MRLTEAFIHGKQVAFQYVPWNNAQPPQLNKARYDDIQSRILSAVLRSLPKQKDEKARMELAQGITQHVMEVVGDELTK